MPNREYTELSGWTTKKKPYFPYEKHIWDQSYALLKFPSCFCTGGPEKNSPVGVKVLKNTKIKEL